MSTQINCIWCKDRNKLKFNHQSQLTIVSHRTTTILNWNLAHGIFSGESMGIDNRSLRRSKHCSSINPSFVISTNYRLELGAPSWLHRHSKFSCPKLNDVLRTNEMYMLVVLRFESNSSICYYGSQLTINETIMRSNSWVELNISIKKYPHHLQVTVFFPIGKYFYSLWCLLFFCFM